ncbi:peptide-methionine (S)-S-oxide reductase MsrA [Candidatus Saccharibacteria bacterium]|nr:peptide-methionine (S)-S-oxide reductase MsrA [Candidatus Saccharibacteria bacterium]
MNQSKLETTTLGGGCFWCLEAVYQEIEGVTSIVSGYSGGHRPNPTYEQVCTGLTGHAEVVQVSFDTQVITFDDVLDIFFTIHNPTSLNFQGNDRGTEYRSIILYQSEAQKRSSEAKIAQIQQLWDEPVVTEVVPLDVFYQAEDYHQNFFATHPGQAYCVAVINPKLAKLRDKFHARLHAEA